VGIADDDRHQNKVDFTLERRCAVLLRYLRRILLSAGDAQAKQ
jgi:hypothetical protein